MVAKGGREVGKTRITGTSEVLSRFGKYLKTVTLLPPLVLGTVLAAAGAALGYLLGGLLGAKIGGPLGEWIGGLFGAAIGGATGFAAGVVYERLNQERVSPEDILESRKVPLKAGGNGWCRCCPKTPSPCGNCGS